MKRLLPAAFIILFPYFIIFLIYSLFHPSLMKIFFRNSFYVGFLYLCIFGLISLTSAVIICVRNLALRRNALELARTNMIIKLVQIPAYLFIFGVGLICALTIFTFGFMFLLMFLDCISIISTGFIGISTVKRSHADGILSTSEMILHGILQFVFCADVVSSILIFRKIKRRRPV